MWVNMKALDWIEVVLCLVLMVVVCIAIYYVAQIKCDALGVEFTFHNALFRW